MEKQSVKIADLKPGSFIHSFGDWFQVMAMFMVANGNILLCLAPGRFGGITFQVEFDPNQVVYAYTELPDAVKEDLKKITN